MSRRIKRLIAENTIRVIAVGPDPTKAGHGTVAVVGLSAEISRIDEVCSEVCKLDEISWAGLCYGRFDLLFIVYVDSQEALLSFIKDKVAAIKGVRAIETFYIAELRKRTPLAPREIA